MKYLVTGGAGFIGSAVCRHLVGTGHTVANLDKMTYAATVGSTAELLSSGRYTLVKGDICDLVAVKSLISNFEPDAILHLAAESHVDRSISGPAAFIDTNIMGTYVMLQGALEYWRQLPRERQAAFRFLQVSTDEVYGSLGADGEFTEETPYAPTSPYSASKASSDHLGLAWVHTFGLPVIVSNCSNNYGPYHFPEKLIPLTILNAVEEKPLPVYGDGSNVRDWLFVEDHARALAMIVQRGRVGEKYNVGGRNEQRNIDVVTKICDLVDERRRPRLGEQRRGLIRFVADRPGHDKRYAIDATKIETEIGWRATESFETGIAKTVEWYLDREDWWGPLRKAYGSARIGLLNP